MNKLTLLIAALVGSTALGQSVPTPVGVAPAAIHLRNEAGFWLPYRSGNTDAARGTALIAAVNAATENDVILLSGGLFDCGTTPLVLDTDGVTVIGSGPATVIDFDILVAGMAVRLYADDLTLSDLTVTNDTQGIGYDTTAGDYPSGHAAERFTIRNVDVICSVDALMFWNTATAATGLVQNSTFTQNGAEDTNFQIDLQLAAGGDILLDAVEVTGGSDQLGTVLIGGTGGEVRLRGCTIHESTAQAGLIQDGSVTVTVENTTYPSSDGTITQAKVFGVTPGATFLSLVDDADAPTARATLGVEKKTFQFQPFAPGAAVTTGDGKAYFAIPAAINGGVITAVRAELVAGSTSGNPNFDLARIRSGSTVDVLSTNLTVDADAGTPELTSATAATAAVINTSNDDLATGDLIRLDVDTAGTGTNFPMITVEVTK